MVSFADATLVLSVGETVEEVGKQSGFLINAHPTLAYSALGADEALCQAHPSGVRQIQNGQVKQWHCPGWKRIKCASDNESQGHWLCREFPWNRSRPHCYCRPAPALDDEMLLRESMSWHPCRTLLWIMAVRFHPTRCVKALSLPPAKH